MGEENDGSALPGPERTPESIVAFYVTQEAGLPSNIQGLGHTVVAINVQGPSETPITQKALRVAFPFKQPIEKPVGLVAFGSDNRCHFVLSASDASKVHCKVWAQLNSGPDVWIIEDSSTHGTKVQDEENARNGEDKTVHGRRQASIGLQGIKIGSSVFRFRAPVSNVELRERDKWFQSNPPFPISKAMFDLQLGGDRYDVCRINRDPIGEGGNAKVYRYMEKNTALFIAIKEQRTETKEQKAMAMKEINFMKALRHHFLVDILIDESYNKPLPRVIIGMPLYRGHLRAILPLPNMPTIERVMFQIAEGLRFLHSNLVLHRDLKPENILVASPEIIKIADYGWATSLKDTDSLYDVCGTLSYCAPEAFKPSEIHTPALDLYSLGAIFYFLLDLDKVERGWVLRYFRGEQAMFNTTFENASKNPPHLFAGLVQSMLAPNPKSRCSLGECIEVVKARNYDWTKQIPWMPMAAPTHLSTCQPGIQRTADIARLQQTPFGNAKATANLPRRIPFARIKRLENRQTQQAPGKCDYKNCAPIVQRQRPATPNLQGLQTQNPCGPAHVHGVNFNAGLPSYEEATRQNPFAAKARKEEKEKKPSHPKLNSYDQNPRHQTKEPPVQRAPEASNPAQQPPNSRQITRRCREHGMIIHRAHGTGVHRRREQLERRTTRKKRVTDLKKGAQDVAKGYFVLYRALFSLACEGLVEGSKRIYKMLNDNPATRKALEHATPSIRADAQLVARLSNRLTASARQRSARDYTEQEMLDHQLCSR